MVSVTIKNKTYIYKQLGNITTWFDSKNNLIVPVVLHTRLREQALEEGADPSIFLSPPRIPAPKEELDFTKEHSSVPKQKKKQATGFINPFSK